jgi:hypothetical protein
MITVCKYHSKLLKACRDKPEGDHVYEEIETYLLATIGHTCSTSVSILGDENGLNCVDDLEAAVSQTQDDITNNASDKQLRDSIPHATGEEESGNTTSEVTPYIFQSNSAYGIELASVPYNKYESVMEFI